MGSKSANEADQYHNFNFWTDDLCPPQNQLEPEKSFGRNQEVKERDQKREFQRFLRDDVL